MPIRTRYDPGPATGIRIRNSDGKYFYQNWFTSYGYCQDIIAEGDNHPFDCRRITKTGGTVTGKQSSGSGYEYIQQPVYWQRANPNSESHLSVATPDDNILAASALSRTNPSRASIDAVVSGLELREIPTLIKDGYKIGTDKLFKHIPRSIFRKLGKAAKLNLMIQFGILPLYSDLQKSLNFQSLVDQRVKELKRYQERGLRRTIALGSWSDSYVDESLTLNINPTFRARLEKRTVVHKKAHVRWRPTYNYKLSDGQLRTLAKEVVLSQKFDPYALYELMPWSWLVDYFTNLGDFVSLNRNTLQASHDAVTIMTHTVTEHIVNGPGLVGSELTCSPIYNVLDWKQRHRQVASLTAHMPFLTGRQTSILGSLAVLKGLR